MFNKVFRGVNRLFRGVNMLFICVNKGFRGVNRLFTCEGVGDAVGVGVQFLVCYHSPLPCQLQARVVGEAIRLGIGEGRRGEGRGEE